MIITLISTSIGFVREISLTFFYGASEVSDVYLIAQTIPMTIFALIGAGLATTFIPIYKKVIKVEGEGAALNFTSNLINIVLAITSIVVIFIIIFTRQIIMAFAPGFAESTIKLAIIFTRMSIFGVYSSGIQYIFSSYLQINNKFAITAMIAVPLNVITILSYILASNTNDIVLAYGIVLSFIVQLLFLIPSIIKCGFNYKLIFNLKDKYIKEILILSIPVILGTSVDQLNVLIDKNIASRVVVGGISALNYANRLTIYVQGLLVVPIITVIYPAISEMVVNSNHEGLKKTINEAVVVISLLLIPITAGTMILAKPIIEMLFFRGEFDNKAVQMTSNALLFYAIGIVPYAYRSVITRVFYSYNDTKTPVINSAIGVTLNIALNLLLMKYMGLAGLAFATSISGACVAILLIVSLRKKFNYFGFKDTSKKLLKISAATFIMAIVVSLAYKQMNGIVGRNLSILFSVISGITVYGTIILRFKLEEVNKLLRIFFLKIKKD